MDRIRGIHSTSYFSTTNEAATIRGADFSTEAEIFLSDDMRETNKDLSYNI